MHDPLVVKDNVGRHPGELRVNKCVECDNWVLLVVKDDLTGALRVLQFQLSPPPPLFLATIKSRMEIFRYRLIQD